MDFGLTSDLDLKIENGEVVLQENGEATAINYFFTDARVNGKRGYWLDISCSEAWTFDQSRLTNEKAVELNEIASEVGKNLVRDGVYDRVNTNAFIANNMVMTLHVMCYNKNIKTVDRKFAV